jgi:hypothetical protein
MPTKQDFLYDKGIFEEEFRKFQLTTAILSGKSILIKNLQERNKETLFNRLTETQIEQSFNEQIFCKLFDYNSHFMKASGNFQMVPKVGRHKSKNDFSLGLIDNNNIISKVTVELKGPLNDLEYDRNSEGLTAIEQAFKYADSSDENSSIAWVIVSNFKYLLLFDKQDRDKCIEFNLLSIATLD